jgi:hypothetical protein
MIHQTVENLDQVLPDYESNRYQLSALNPFWELKLYTSDDREDFIRSKYGKEILNAYLSIDARYGAARADFFRYLVILELGGLYLDIKATARKDLNSIIGVDDSFITAQWPTFIDGIDVTSIGIHQDLSFREYQNWFILATPQHIILEQVVEQVLRNLRNYNPFSNGVGKFGVLRITGPIAYSKVVHSCIDLPGVRIATNEELGFSPSVHKVTSASNPFPNRQSSPHYSALRIPIVRRSAALTFIVPVYFKIRSKVDRIFEKITRLPEP